MICQTCVFSIYLNEKKSNMEKITEINQQIDDWVKKYFDPNFEFRKYQKESIANIIQSVIDSEFIVEIEAPTGSGKSIILLIAAGVLWKYYHKTSYILCSDLSLFDQYADVLNNLDLPFGKLKGQDNYPCMRTGGSISKADCKVQGLSWGTLCDDAKARKCGYSCALTCEYCINRKKALDSPVTIMTYQLWLTVMNMTSAISKPQEKHFKPRDVIFCDECHKIPDIVSLFVSCSMNPWYFGPKLCDCIKWYNDSFLESKDRMQDIDSRIKNLQSSIEQDYKPVVQKAKEGYNIDNTEALKHIDKYYDNFIDYEHMLSKIVNVLSKKYVTKKITKDESKVMFAAADVMQNIGEYNTIRTSLDEIWKESGQDGLAMQQHYTKKDMKPVTVLRCAKEDILINKKMFPFGNHFILTSATIGDNQAYDDNIGVRLTKLKKSVHCRIPTTFDYAESPIYFLPNYRMSFANLNESFEKLKLVVANLLEVHKGERGIIHTGSYNISKKLIDYLESIGCKRILRYDDSKDKLRKLEDFSFYDDKILIGPTLLEGLDLKDDMCRFIICLKVPYPNLSDNLIQAKLKLFPRFYDSATCNGIIQGIGRGVRHDKDWCKTYILDGCFKTLYYRNKKVFDDSFKERLKRIDL